MENVQADNKWNKAMYGILLLLALAANLSTGAASFGIAVGAILMIGQGIYTHKWPQADKGLITVIVIYLALWSLVASQSIEPGRSFGDVWATAYRFLPLFFAMLYLRSLKQVKYLLLVFAVSVLADDLYAAVQFLFMDVQRPVGFNNTATFIASHMLMAIPVLCLLSRKKYFSSNQRIFMFGTGILSLLVLVATETRGGWVAFFASALVFVLLDRKYRKKALLGGCLLLVLFLSLTMFSASFKDRVASIADPQHTTNTERLLMWDSALQIAKDYPAFGIGQDEFAWYYNTTYISPLAKERGSADDPRDGHGHPHNNLLKMLTEGGMVGLAAFLLLHGYILYRLGRLYGQERKFMEASYALAGILIFVGIQIEGLTDTNINQVPIMREYWLLMGTLLVAGKLERAQDTANSPQIRASEE